MNNAKDRSTLIDKYADWLKNEIEVRFTPDDLDLPILEECERSFLVDVPFLDRHNDWLSFCVDLSETDGTITLSDLGHMRNDETDNEKLMNTDPINAICRSLGVTNGESLEKQCTVEGFPMAFSMFCTCLVKVSAVLEVLEDMEI